MHVFPSLLCPILAKLLQRLPPLQVPPETIDGLLTACRNASFQRVQQAVQVRISLPIGGPSMSKAQGKTPFNAMKARRLPTPLLQNGHMLPLCSDF